MTLDEYNALDEEKQFHAVFGNALPVAERTEGEFNFILYQLFSFYIEFKYHVNDKTVIQLRTISTADELKPYLDTIDLKELMSGK